MGSGSLPRFAGSQPDPIFPRGRLEKGKGEWLCSIFGRSKVQGQSHLACMQCIGLLGQPRMQRTNPLGQRDERYEGFRVRYAVSNGLMCEATFSTACDVRFAGVSLFTDATAVQLIADRDGLALQGPGYVVIRNLGTALADFDSDQEADMPLRTRWPFTHDRMSSARSCSSIKCRKFRIVVSSGIDACDDSRELAQRRHVQQGVLHTRIAECEPVLHQVDAQHRGQRVRAPTFPASG